MFRSFFSRYFGFDEPVDRQTYLRTGIVLMALKYAVDAFAIHEVTGLIWTPADYLLPLLTVRAAKMHAFPLPFATGLIL